MKRNSKIMPRGFVRGALTLVAALLVAAYAYFSGTSNIDENASLEMHFIDVGQGDASLLVSDEAFVVVDCGPVSSSDVLCEYIRTYTDRIDCLVISHPHEDHMGGAATLIENFEIGEIIMEGYDEFEDDAPVFYERAYDAMVERELYPVLAVPGDTHSYGDITLEILAPCRDYGDRNNNSIVLKATCDGASVLFTGDAESTAEADILKNGAERLGANVLKVGHHGSSTSTTKAFYDAVSPDIAVISCGRDNSYGHPHAELIELFEEKGQEYYRTDETGSVVLVCRDGEICLK